ncbi:MAG: hypothetical protein FWD05_05835 [Oscillospiraceae bacterium]|nr:hypothetical protein [Oscillospiraceae bacterium]
MSGGRGDISLRFTDYQSALAAVQVGIQNLTPSTSEVLEISEQAPTMRQYRMRLEEFSRVLIQLESLLEKDYQNLQTIERELVSADLTLSERVMGALAGAIASANVAAGGNPPRGGR